MFGDRPAEARGILRAALIWVSVALLAGCAVVRPVSVALAPAPNLYTFENGEPYPVDRVAPRLRSTQSDVLYVTNRGLKSGGPGEETKYGNQRSTSMAFGVSRVDYGGLDDWNELVRRTQTANAQTITRLRPIGTTELARFPASPLPFAPGGGRLQTTPEAGAAYRRGSDVMRSEISQRLRANNQNRVLVYIHGVSNTFEDSINSLATIWHYGGRQSLPVAYSWPAGNSGVLAYFRDSEAGDFSVFHVKEFIRMLASVPEVDQIDIVAHSRGTAVMTDALRELIIEARGGGRDPKAEFKLGILVLAAADLDTGVVGQRLIAERFGLAFEQINIYANPNDQALRLSGFIGKVTRVGERDADSFSPEELAAFDRIGTVNTIIVAEAGGNLGHSYFRENPAVVSDIVLAMRSRALPGTPFRPLEKVFSSVWRLHPNYPAEDLPDVLDRGPQDR